MKKILHPFYLAGIIFLASCGGDDPLPAPEVSFITDPGVVEVGVPTMFENRSLKASSYLWDFGGGVTSTDISPTVTFDSRGELYVKLTANTDDGQMVTDSILVSVKERVFTGYFINVFPETNGAANWDLAPVAPDTVFADLLVLIVADAAENLDNAVFDGIFEVANGPVFRTSDNIGLLSDVVLTDETWVFGLADYDGPTDEIDLTQQEDIAQFGFNPVTGATVKNEEGDAGFVSIFFQDQTTGAVVDVDIAFEIK